MIDYIEKAKTFAMMAHKGQTDKAGEDYFTAHVAVVADGVEPDPLVKAAAYLHDTVEDTGIVLGRAFKQALGDRSGIVRYGHAMIPMDEALGFCAVDVSGRPYLVFDAAFPQERVGDFDTCMTEEFFRALSDNAGFTLHLRCPYGKNSHHMIEALFKACAHALCDATAENSTGAVLSTKGTL